MIQQRIEFALDVHSGEVCHRQNRIPLQTNCLLLDDGSAKVLIESSFGDKWSEKERGFYELERRTIVDALESANWVISGPKGAASVLGLKRSTLQARMEKLGIRRARTAEQS